MGKWRDMKECQAMNLGENTVYQQYIRYYKKKYVMYRWKTTLSPAHLNNKIDMGSEIKIWEYNRQRMKKILQKIKENEALGQNAIGIIGDFQSFTKPENWNELSTQIMTQNPH